MISGSAFVVSLLIARYFGARGFGEYSKATTFIGIFYLFTDFGMNAVVLKKITHKPESENNIINSLFGLRMLTGVLMIIISLAVTYFLPYDNLRNEGFTQTAKSAIMILSTMILYQAFLNTVNVVFQKHLKYEQSTLANIVGSIITLIAVVTLLSFGFSLSGVLSGYTIGAIGASMVLFLFVGRLAKKFQPRFDWGEYKTLIKQSLPLGLTLVFNLVYFRADVFILTLYRSTVEVGTYGLAFKFFEFPLSLPIFFVNSIYPVLLARSHDKQVFKSISVKAAIFLFGASLLTMLAFYLAAPALSLIRSDFYPSIAVLRLLSLSMPIFFLSSLLMWILITFGKNKQLLITYFLGMVLNIALNLLLIPVYGVTAAAAVTLISEVFVFIVSGYLVVKLLH